jgi:hypothetical protein
MEVGDGGVEVEERRDGGYGVARWAVGVSVSGQEGTRVERGGGGGVGGGGGWGRVVWMSNLSASPVAAWPCGASRFGRACAGEVATSLRPACVYFVDLKKIRKYQQYLFLTKTNVTRRESHSRVAARIKKNAIVVRENFGNLAPLIIRENFGDLGSLVAAVGIL